jgi:DNA-binding IclR family transcriptional regulator
VDTGYSHFLGKFVNGRVALTCVAEGHRSPYLEDLVPGFDDGAHATAMGKALLATLRPDERIRYVRESGMRPYTRATFDNVDALEADIVAGERRGMQVELGQFRDGVGCAGIPVIHDRDPERRVVLAVAAPLDELTRSATTFRARLGEMSRELASLMSGDGMPAMRAVPEPRAAPTNRH